MARPLHRPRSILLLKCHSSGIGDILRSSAAWRALRDRFPDALLHLWFLARNPASTSKELISRHDLLASFQLTDKRTHGWAGWRRLLREARGIAQTRQPDLVIDFEPNGIRTSILARLFRHWTGAVTVGVSQVPSRGLFYKISSSSFSSYARQRGLPFPLEYTERDFVALSALGIERGETAIELNETEEGLHLRKWLRSEAGGKPDAPLLGLNIGCGTPDAVCKRPEFDLLVPLVSELQRRHACTLVLTGAPFEQAINREFLSVFPAQGPVIDLAGRTSLPELTGAIKACQLFISSDSGPYHMSVALRIPTLAIFRRPNPVHYHHHDWVDCVVAPGKDQLPQLLQAAERLFSSTPPTPNGSPVSAPVTSF
jgi:ADP-heptose:LPS heptosyltransferase